MSQTGEKLAKVRKGCEAAKSWRSDEHFRGLPKPVANTRNAMGEGAMRFKRGKWEPVFSLDLHHWASNWLSILKTCRFNIALNKSRQALIQHVLMIR
jgi:hypothetical protein